MEWNGPEWNRMHRYGPDRIVTERNRTEQDGTEWTVADQTGSLRGGMERNRTERNGTYRAHIFRSLALSHAPINRIKRKRPSYSIVQSVYTTYALPGIPVRFTMEALVLSVGAFLVCIALYANVYCCHRPCYCCCCYY